MRLRNIPGARDVIAGHEAVIKNEKEQKGHWEEVFGNDHPVRVEIGMGKGRFLMTMALEHPGNKLYWNRAILQCASAGAGADGCHGGTAF